ncbi:ABC transporter ATP-binding protein [Desulfobacula sp.]|uniref:ABC transporter ATP-binding protein n=1 Tax=Desulfobacula sp. TaxID=2593537 RepID=UPI00261025E4|nr:ABC transporter ATP-binding protein [Desulfobacula sp.]
MPVISLSSITNHICQGTDLQVHDGELLVLAGATGAGKTTLLNVIAGLTSYGGSVQFNGTCVDSLPPSKRNVGYLFQDFALFPHLTVTENIAFGLQARGLDKKVISHRVSELLALLKIESLNNRYPKSLSGGEKQRIALARTLAPHPEILLLDEPFSNLDQRTAKFLRLEIKSLQQKLGLTAVYVTHNQMEAFEMGDRLAVIKNGQIEQIGTPVEILFNPITPAVSELFGAPNIFQCSRIDALDFGLGKANCGRLTLIVPYDGKAVDKIAVFPSGVRLSRHPINTPMPNRLQGIVLDVRLKPPVVMVDIQVNDEKITAELPSQLWEKIHIEISDPVYATISLKWIRVLTK